MSTHSLHYSIKVTGRVQGVGYRAFAARIAQSLKLRGYVKNQPDGSVLVEAEGSVEQLDRLIIECKKGPGWAHVDNVIYSESPIQSFEDFRIRY